MGIYFASIARHLLTGLGGGLLAIGIEQGDVNGFVAASTPIVAGVLSYAVGQGLSLLSKLKK